MIYYTCTSRRGGVTINMLASARVRLIASSITPSGQTKDYKIGISCLTNKHVELRNKNKDVLARNRDNVFK
jgi:hypothetical protein